MADLRIPSYATSAAELAARARLAVLDLANLAHDERYDTLGDLGERFAFVARAYTYAQAVVEAAADAVTVASSYERNPDKEDPDVQAEAYEEVKKLHDRAAAFVTAIGELGPW